MRKPRLNLAAERDKLIAPECARELDALAHGHMVARQAIPRGAGTVDWV